MRENPFRYGLPVEGEFYYHRRSLSNGCLSLLKDGMSIILTGPRRSGKTSFAKNICLQWRKAGFGEAVLVDTYNVSTHQDFLLQLVAALGREKSLWRRFADWAKNASTKALPKNLSVERPDFGKLTLSWVSGYDPHEKKALIQHALESLGGSGHTLVVIDEFQQLSAESLNDDSWLEATLREFMQRQVGKVAYLLTGSRRDMVNAMVNNSSRPLYRSSQMLDFPPLDHGFSDWIAGRFHKVGVACRSEEVDYLRKEVRDSPNYVQTVGYHLVAMGCEKVETAVIDEALSTIASQNAYAYETHLQNLSPVQQHVLRMLALENEGYYSETLLKQYEISSTAHVTNAVNSLKKKNLLDQETSQRGKPVFDDPLFRLWLRHKFGGPVIEKV